MLEVISALDLGFCLNKGFDLSLFVVEFGFEFLFREENYGYFVGLKVFRCVEVFYGLGMDEEDEV